MICQTKPFLYASVFLQISNKRGFSAKTPGTWKVTEFTFHVCCLFSYGLDGWVRMLIWVEKNLICFGVGSKNRGCVWSALSLR